MKQKGLSLFLVGGLLMSSTTYADEFSMRTAVPVGQSICIALNENVEAQLVWGDGSTQTHIFDGSEASFVVKHADLKIQSTQSITSIYCADNQLTTLTLTDVPQLRALQCAYNQLSSIDLQDVPMLATLNIKANALKSFAMPDLPALRTIDCSYNQLTKLTLHRNHQVESLICSGNQLSSMMVYPAQSLQCLWCQDNRIQRFDLGNAEQLTQFVAYNNKLVALPMPKMAHVTEMWVDNNRLKSLDFSANSLVVLSASHNRLTDIQLNTNDKNVLKAFYVDHNQLPHSAFPDLFKYPTLDTLITCCIDSQAVIELPAQVEVKTPIDMSAYMGGTNAWGSSLYPRIRWKRAEDDTPLTLGRDYNERDHVTTFRKPFARVYAEITSLIYPTVLRTTELQIVDPTAVEALDGTKLRITTRAGQLRVIAAEPVTLQVYNAYGIRCIHQSLEAGTFSCALPAGIYIVNGQKVIVQ